MDTVSCGAGATSRDAVPVPGVADNASNVVDVDFVRADVDADTVLGADSLGV